METVYLIPCQRTPHHCKLSAVRLPAAPARSLLLVMPERVKRKGDKAQLLLPKPTARLRTWAVKSKGKR